MEKNDIENSNKNTKKLFTKGGPGGPGRGKTKSKEVIVDGELLDAIEQVVRDGMASKENRDKLKAASIGIRVKQIRGNDDKEKVVDAFAEKLIHFLHDLAGGYLNATGNPISPYDLIVLMSKVCPECSRLPSKADDLIDVDDCL